MHDQLCSPTKTAIKPKIMISLTLVHSYNNKKKVIVALAVVVKLTKIAIIEVILAFLLAVISNKNMESLREAGQPHPLTLPHHVTRMTLH